MNPNSEPKKPSVRSTVTLLVIALFPCSGAVFGIWTLFFSNPVTWTTVVQVVGPVNRYGVMELGLVEKAMGGKGTEIANPRGLVKSSEFRYPDKRDYFGDERSFNAKMKLVGDSASVDEDGTHVKWLRWGDQKRYLIAAVLDDKVFFVGLAGVPAPFFRFH
jgi:hypothetical protein